jgi:predicted transcriptional regulator
MAEAGMARTRAKWGDATIDAGFTILPNHLLAINQFLTVERQLTPTEMFVILQVLLAWWSADRLPFPSKAAIAGRTGLSTRQIQRALASLEEKGFLQRTARFEGGRGRMTNLYDPNGLVKTVQEFAAKQPDIFARPTP